MKKILAPLVMGCYMMGAQAQDLNTNFKESKYQFTIDKELNATSIKNQNKSGTCWSFSTSSFLESELIRMGKPPVDLSMMWVVRNMYAEKADNYVRRQGKAQFAEGGEPHDVMNCVRRYGIVPLSAYNGANSNVNGTPVHTEMDAVLAGFVKTIADRPELSPNWKNAFNGMLDAYLGPKIDSFMYQGAMTTPKDFAKSLGIKPDDYVEITSFTHHPFYKPFVLEVADNWDNGAVYNVPLDELQQIVDNAIKTGYSVEWAADVSEKYFSFKKGLAIVPDVQLDTVSSTESLTKFFNEPSPEKKVDQTMRQQAFDNLTTTDDHGMQFVGLAHDQKNNPYYLVKNSWGATYNDMKGYFYCSVPYFRYKTTCIMVHKNAIPKAIAQKLGI